MANKHHFQEVPEEYHEALCAIRDEEEEEESEVVEEGIKRKLKSAALTGIEAFFTKLFDEFKDMK